MIISLKSISRKLLFIYIIALYLFSFRTETVKISELVFYLFAAVSVVSGLRLRRWDFNFRDFQWLILFLGIALLSATWAINKSVALSRGISLVFLVMIVLFIYNDFDMYSINVIIIAFLVAGAMSTLMSIGTYGLIGFINATMQGKRLSGTMVAANTYGVYMAISFVCGLYLLFKQKHKLFTGICVTLVALGLLSSNSRNGFLVCIAGTCIFFLLFFKNIKLSKKLWYLAVVTAIGGLLYRYGLFDGILARLDSTTLAGGGDRSVNIRMFMIQFGLKAFLSSPFWGYGLNNAQFLLESYFARTYLHNNYIELLVDVGLFGFLAYYCCFVSILIRLNKARKNQTLYSDYSDTAILLFVICIMLLIADISIVFYYNKMTYIVLGASMALLKQNNSQEEKCDV